MKWKKLNHNMPLRPIYYDTETTGVKPDRDRIIEIAAYDPERNQRFEKFVNPGCPIPPEATAIHHITNDMVASASSFAIVGAEFIDFCEGEVVLIAHNNDSFDYQFLRIEFERHALQMPAWKFLDSLKWARRYRPDLPRHTLQFLREIYEIAANNAHRALDDVIVLHQLFQSLIDDLSIEDVYALLNNPRTIQSMPFGKHQGQPLNQIPRSYIQWLASSGAFEKPENKELKDNFQRLGLLTALSGAV
jgi:DNA polymerase-3 subunit epsilon